MIENLTKEQLENKLNEIYKLCENISYENNAVILSNLIKNIIKRNDNEIQF